ncbi:hypothetical protein BO85DRAFT_464557 [Aspergillus piperis CBS 112811]|uniref:Uncharacterized protein n=1 Tax=Aspergillus piperis CBS 112811 TaxID=1448313 RepID=A0A8G1QQB8_9EURO|nr:hypothetical protein BO85DRAFT_464557 [Aspergillus piperis CBS 112811]RAH51693.1 hypothetical protein BO85DRAFT_464557 [Aspergillus piperis CBS 112811]
MDKNVLYVTTGRLECAVTLMQPTDRTHCGGLPTFRPSGKYWRRWASKVGYNNMLTLRSRKLRLTIYLRHDGFCSRWVCHGDTGNRGLNARLSGATFLLFLNGYVSNTRLRAVKLACGVKIRRPFYWLLITWLCGTKAKKTPKSDAVGISPYPVYAQANLQSLHYDRKQQNTHAERMSMLTENTRMHDTSNVEESSRTRGRKTVN